MTFTDILLLLLGALFIGIYKSIEKSIGNLPDRIHDKNMQEIKAQDERLLQIESYYRQISGAEIEKTFYDWTSLLTKMDENVKNLETPEGLEKMKDMQTKILMYGSSKTVKIHTLMMRNAYKINESDKIPKEEQLYISRKTIVYFSAVIASLKEDFTGYKIDIDDILKITIKDYNTPENNEIFEKAVKEVNNEIENI